MIQANELRLGNYILTLDGRVETVKYIMGDSANENPIPLTEEWLEKFGFKKAFAYPDTVPPAPHWEKEEKAAALYCLYFYKTDKGFDLVTSPEMGETIANVQYVHSLQNLYFALTGQELTIKDSIISDLW